MAQNIVCSMCEEEFSAPESAVELWLICPYCAGRTPNPPAFDKRSKTGVPASGFRAVGTLFMVFAGLGTLVSYCGGLCLIPMGFATPVYLALIGFTTSFLLGVMLFQLDQNLGRRYGKLIGQATLVGMLVFLAALGALVFAFATCFNGSM